VDGVDGRPSRRHGSVSAELVDRRVGVGHQQRRTRLGSESHTSVATSRGIVRADVLRCQDASGGCGDGPPNRHSGATERRGRAGRCRDQTRPTAIVVLNVSVW
jgi:hypothetical protein